MIARDDEHQEWAELLVCYAYQRCKQLKSVLERPCTEALVLWLSLDD